jgi:uncharacterized protein (DUF305 family)
VSTTLTAPPIDADHAEAPPRRSFGVGILVLAVVVSLLAGLAAGVLLLRPDPAPGDTSPEAGFARDMITHHDQAVTMGMVAYQHATSAAVRQIGYDIAMNQQGEIGTMNQWLRDWDLLPTGTAPRMAWMDLPLAEGDLMPGMASADRLTELQEAQGDDVDRLFLELMINHHLGGLHMIDGVLDRTDDSNVTWLAELMRASQERDLQAMDQLQTELGFS